MVSGTSVSIGDEAAGLAANDVPVGTCLQPYGFKDFDHAHSDLAIDPGSIA